MGFNPIFSASAGANGGFDSRHRQLYNRFLKMSNDQNDLLVLLEQSETANDLLEAIEAYQDGQVSFA